jgi:hypothetical protein
MKSTNNLTNKKVWGNFWEGYEVKKAKKEDLKIFLGKYLPELKTREERRGEERRGEERRSHLLKLEDFPAGMQHGFTNLYVKTCLCLIFILIKA